MYWKLLIAVSIAEGVLAPVMRGNACTVGSLSSYIALGSPGCTVAGLSFMDFGFSTISSTGSPTPVTAGAITITPTIVNQKVGLTYSSSGFDVSSGHAIQYLLAYTIDDPPIIHGYELDMFTDPPTFPGLVQIDSRECLGSAFSGSSCSGSTALNTVSDNGMSATHQNIEFFSPVVTVGERTTITLDATSGGAASFTRFDELATVPEPSTLPLMAGSVLFLLTGSLLLRRVRTAR